MKRTTQLRIINTTCLTLALALGLAALAASDGSSRYWEGKAFGGAIAIIGVLGLAFGIIAVGTYKETRDMKKTFGALKEAVLALLSYDWLKPLTKRRK